MTVPPTESGEGDPGQFTRIAEEFLRLHEAGKLADLDEFCARYPQEQQAHVRQECEQLLRIQGVIKPPNRLTPGQKLGSYEIVEPIGKGGMGEVYRARDLELDRDIAIKVLPPELACQSERVKRFKREAKAIAALDHPNIVTIHSVEESDGLHFITMQLVQGKTLSEMIPRKGQTLETFFDLAIPLADAISSAHESGITHRDLKPANIMVTAEGRVEVLDFGLAKLTEHTTAERSTQHHLTPLTVEGQIVGTMAYMSPEQAEGREVDHRTDIFSLGIILYEMATGKRPFNGETRVALLASIMKDTPAAITEVNTALPRHLGRIVRRCLTKDVRQRYQTTADVRNELAELRREVESGETIAPAQIASGRRWLWPSVSGALVVVLLLILLLPEPVGDWPRVLGDPEQITDLDGLQRWPSLSSNGEQLLYKDETSGNGDIYLQLGANALNLTDEFPGLDLHPAFSPDDSRIAFSSGHDGRGIYVMDAGGKGPMRLTDGGYHPSWSRDGDRIVYSTTQANPYGGGARGRLYIYDFRTRERTLLFDHGSPPTDSRQPSWSPKDKRIAFFVQIGGQRDIWTISVSGEDPRAVTDGPSTDWGAFWSADGEYLYFISDRGGKAGLWAVAINEETGETRGPPHPVWEPASLHVTQASISRDGTKIACTVQRRECRITRAAFDPDTGRLGDAETMYSSSIYSFIQPRLSTSGEWLAFQSSAPENVYTMRTKGGSDPVPLTEDHERDRNPAWYSLVDSDGREWLTWQSTREAGSGYKLFMARPDRSGPIEQLTYPPEVIHDPIWWPDGTRVSVTIDGVGLRILEFPDGPTNPPLPNTYLHGGRAFGGDASWSREGPNGRRLVAQRRDGGLWVFDPRRVSGKFVRDEDGNRPISRGYYDRWLDHSRLIFWDQELDRAFLWDYDTEQMKHIEGIEQPGSFVFSEDGTILYMFQTETHSDIWRLNMSR